MSLSCPHVSFRRRSRNEVVASKKTLAVRALADEVYPVVREMRPIRTHKEVGAIIGISEQAVVQIQNRAFRKIIRAMREYIVTDEAKI